MADESPPNVDELVARLRTRVADRRASGAYPPGLEEELDAHFRRIAVHRAEPYDFSRLRDGLARLDQAMAFSVDSPASSEVPGGELVHRTISKVVRRQTQSVIEQVQRFGDEVRDILREIVAAVQHPSTHGHPELIGQIDVILERLVAYERIPSDPGVAVADLRRRIEALETAEAARHFKPWFGNEEFEAHFRGSPSELRERYRDLAARFAGCSPVVDIGFGRGEFLELLADQGLDVLGVEVDPELVKSARARGLHVEQGGAVEWLASATDGSLGGISMIQVIEHLEPQEVVQVVALAREKLRPGGRVLIETLNPQSLYIFARAFYADPTHDRPVHPAYLTFLFREAGFAEVDIDWRSPPPEDEVLEPIDGEGPLEVAFNANVARLNRILFAPQDYALVAVR